MTPSKRCLLRNIGARALAMLIAFVLAACRDREVLPERLPESVRTQTVHATNNAPVLAQTGEIRAQVQTDLAFRVSGRITERHVEVGDHVAVGDVLAKIYSKEQHADVTAAEAAVKAAEAQFKQASQTMGRQKMLLSSGSSSRLEYDQAIEGFRTAQGSLDAAKAQLATAREVLAHTELRASNPGLITARNADVGQVVQAAQSVFTLAHDGPRDAVFQINESAFRGQPIDRNAKVEVRLMADPSVKVVGKIREVAPTVNEASETVTMKIGIERPPPEMSLGATVTASGRFEPAISFILPPTALAAKDGQPAVWIVDPKTKTVSLRSIQVERYDTTGIVVQSGLQSGEIVVSAGAQLLRPNQTVALAEENAR